ncbi:MFS transporter [Bacillus sp. NEB1478]|uniref:MDR family MFS transporter n=1 Tax=Bacillus sp. NEB1478 TaxID=3073816 RepID=UPI002872EAD1|nr:MFS transporter [Bacillus sp. NEB1478]WNB90204.1 MFS transporter [Bacillus sp. NEB1478]
MRFRDFHSNIKIRIIESLISGSIGGMIYPFMAIYLADRVGETLTGILLIVNIFVGFIVGFYGGYYADLMGRKKIMAYAESLRFGGILVMALANSPLVTSDTFAAYITIGMMMVNSICWGLAGPASQAMLIDVSTPENRKFMYGITYWTSNLSIAIGGLLGGFLFKNYLFELLLGLTATSLLSAVLVVFFIKETYIPVQIEYKIKPNVVKEMFSNYKQVFKDSVFIKFTFGYLLILSLEFHLTNYISVKLSKDMPTQDLLQFHIDGVQMLGILRTENTVLVVLLAVFISRIINRFKDKNVLYIGLITYSIGYLVISYSNSVWLLLSVMIIATIGELMYVPVKQAYMAEIPPEDSRSAYMAVSGMIFNGAMVIAALSITLGHYISPLGMTALFTICAVTGFFLFKSTVPELDKNREQMKRATA